MSATITINFAGGSATANTVSVALTDCTVSPGPSSGVAVALASAVTNITVSEDQVSFATGANAEFSGSIEIALAWQGSALPMVTLNGLASHSSPATVSWPTASGMEIQILTPGNRQPLPGIVAS